MSSPSSLMERMNALTDAPKRISSAEKRGKCQALLRPCSRVVIPFLTMVVKPGYIDEFEIIDDDRAGKNAVNCTRTLSKCAVISPRFESSKT